MTDDLHRRVAYDLVMNNDVILLPTFETKNMVVKDNRKINTKTVRSINCQESGMKQLPHFVLLILIIIRTIKIKIKIKIKNSKSNGEVTQTEVCTPFLT